MMVVKEDDDTRTCLLLRRLKGREKVCGWLIDSAMASNDTNDNSLERKFLLLYHSNQET